MPTEQENPELVKFYHNLRQDIKTSQISEENGGTLEQIFTQVAIDLLIEAGETENARVAYDEKASKIGQINHKINGYAISDNYETLDLFITIFSDNDEFERVMKDEVDKSAKRITKFFNNAINKAYVHEIEEACEIFDLAHTLSNSGELKENLVRINFIILTNGVYPGDIPSNQKISGFPAYYRIIDLNYLYNISEKSHIPIEINFKEENIKIPCISIPRANEDYQSYLAIIQGITLTSIYERFGSRLLEQNVRSFLQFTGKINKGIRKTILEEPHMFLAFNNGISATAEEIILEEMPNNQGAIISYVKDLQIVNGGQTTASIYHTWKKDKADISQVFVQLKLSVINKKEKFSEVVSRISEYANTQNKVSVSDLSSNRPYHIMLEKLSRNIWAPPSDKQSIQTMWFYERARGQYKNARVKEGFTKARQKAFDLKNPRSQMFNKEDLAKYLNCYQEKLNGKKLVVGPHFVVRGNQKNYVQFINYNVIDNPDGDYYIDLIAKAILFRSAEKIYGIKPNSIGDMRYITVPYSVALIGLFTNYKLDLYKIWQNQSISEDLKKLLYILMEKVEKFIKKNAPGSLYGEWAKKEECWTEIQDNDFKIDWTKINEDLMNSKSSKQRKSVSSIEIDLNLKHQESEKIRSIPPEMWYRFEEWGRETNNLSPVQLTAAYNLAIKVGKDVEIIGVDKVIGLKIIEIVCEKAPELFAQIDTLPELSRPTSSPKPVISIELIDKMNKWEKKNRKLETYKRNFMLEVANGIKPLDNRAEKYIMNNLRFIKRLGFDEFGD
jgi:hypothetical protein